MSDTHVSEAEQQEMEEQREAALNEMDEATHQMVNDVRAKVSTPSFVFGRNAATNEELLQKAADTPVRHRDYGKKGIIPIFPVTCPECSKALLWPSLRLHRTKVHGWAGTQNMTMEFYRSIEFFGPYEPRSKGRPRGIKNGTKAKAKKVKQTAVAPVVPKAPKPTPIAPQELTALVLEALFPKGVPVSKLRSVARWMEATDTFIEEAEL